MISKPVADDIEEIQNLLFETWLVTYPNKEVGITKEDIEEKFLHRLDTEEINRIKENITLDVPNRLHLIAKDGKKIIGVCRAFVREKHNQLQAIYVLPGYQGRGIGRMFWQECLSFFDPMKDTIVEVAIYNKNAIVFYEKLGFTDTGVRLTDEHHRMPVSKVIIPEMRMVLKAKI